MHRFQLFLFLSMAWVVAAGSRGVAQTPSHELRRGDHVVYIGNTLADRMQHHGWLETYLHALHPRHELTFRNLGFSGDEVKLRQRADNFGDADQWLTKCEADVVACFFGYNEALRGESGLAAFGKDLAEMLGHMQRQTYNGHTPPRIYVFSPLAHEDLHSPHLPDGTANNQSLARYTQVMEQVCAGMEIPFVNLFDISRRLYAQNEQPLTMNGIHLLDEGNRVLAREILAKLAPDATLPTDDEIVELRNAVLDKNYHWFSRYRVVDEYNVFGGRSKLAWFGQSNADVMMREMEIFDIMTANRDKRIWALAQGQEYVVRDDNLPENLVVRPNREGPLENGAFPYLGGEEAIERMQVAKGMEVNLYASEEQFPRLINPVQMSVDPDGRLWASVWPSYPHWNPTEPRQDALVILPDEDGDGKADELIVFADELNSITGFEFWGGGVLVAAPPEIWFLKDTDGDNRADHKVRMLQGVSSADTHHSANAMLLGPDGWLYWSRGVFNVAAFETPTKTYRSGQSGVHRFNPRTFEVEFHYPIGPNPHGDVFDRWGFQFANDGTTGTGGYVSIGKGQRPGNRQWFKKEWRPVAATGILSSSHFPDENQNNFLICNTIGFLGVLQYEVEYQGAEITAQRTEDLLRSTDENFRPVDIEIGGDGALYVADWHNALIGHMQHNMRDPNRDHSHGRIYRVTSSGGALLQPVQMSQMSIEEVLEQFFAYENSVRYRARLELTGRDARDVISAVTEFAESLNPRQASVERDEAQALLECLWVLEEQRTPDLSLVAKTYRAVEPRVRAAAIRTLGHWAGRVDGWEPLLELAAQDDSALVRAEAVKAAANFEGLVAAEVIFEVATSELDPELEDVLNYARKQIQVDQMIAEAVAQKKTISKSAREYALQNAKPELLLAMEQSDAVYDALLTREDVGIAHRWRAIDALARSQALPRARQLLNSLMDSERKGAPSLGDLASMLAELSQADLAQADASALKGVVEETQSNVVRRTAFAAWFRLGDSEEAWRSALESREKLSDALQGLSSIANKEQVKGVFERVRSLMTRLPDHLQSDRDSLPVASGPAVAYEYFAPNPSNVANETLDGLTPQLTGTMEGFAKYVPGGKIDGFAIRQTAALVVPTAGVYRFYVNSDDGSRLYVDEAEVVQNDGNHGMVERSGTVRLDPGMHQVVVNYYDNGGGDGLIVAWEGPGFSKQIITPEVLRPAGGGNLIKQALDVATIWPAEVRSKIADFVELAVGDSAVATYALESLATLPVDETATQVAKQDSVVLTDRIVALAAEATPVEKQMPGYSRLLNLGRALAIKSNDKTADRALRRLRDSIPVKADANVMMLGEEVYKRESHCATCHQTHGQGLPNLYPPLDGSLWALGSEERLIRLALDGMHGTIEVKGKTYSSPPLPPMTGFRHLLDDRELAAVLTFVRNSWTNRAKPISAATVSKIRALPRGKDAVFWNANELMELYPMEDGRQPIEQQQSDDWVPQLVQEWTTDDFSGELELAGRSFEQGRLAFQRIGCAQCHKLGEEGGVFGPNLAELEPKKRTPAYILDSILNPSKDVEAKYAIRTYLLDSGTVVSGFVVHETNSQVELKSDPLSPDESVTVEKDEIEAESSSKRSIMPQGLLNWLTKEEILDLIAYVQASGNASNSVFAK